MHVQFTDGIQGVNMLVIKSSDAKIIADLMMGGSGQPMGEDLTEMDISAVQEAMNQMMGSSATSMSTVFNTMVNISPPGIDVINLSEDQENIPNEDILIKVSFRLRVGSLIDSNIMQLTTIDFAKNMVNRLLGTETDSAADDYVQLRNDDAQNVPSYATNYTEENPHQQMVSAPEVRHNEQREMVYSPSGNVTNKSQVSQNPKIQAAHFMDFESQNQTRNFDPNLDILMDIPLQITVELGRTKKMIKEILEMAQGSIIELDKLAGEPVDILANNKLIAKGEVVVIDENFGVRVIDIISQYDRIRKLQ